MCNRTMMRAHVEAPQTTGPTRYSPTMSTHWLNAYSRAGLRDTQPLGLGVSKRVKVRCTGAILIVAIALVQPGALQVRNPMAVQMIYRASSVPGHARAGNEKA
jgi:hypothetical protein